MFVACRPQLWLAPLQIGWSGGQVTARCRRNLLVKLTVAQLLKIFLAFYVHYRIHMSPPPLQENPVLTFIIFQDVSFLQVSHPKLQTHFPCIPFVLHRLCYFSWPSQSPESLFFVLTGCINTLHVASGFSTDRPVRAKVNQTTPTHLPHA
jgi:hypothetical protein